MNASEQVLPVAREAGKLLALAICSFVLAIASATFVFSIFYWRVGGPGPSLDTFKLWFWLGYAAFIVLAAGATLLLGSLLRVPLFLSLGVAVVVVGLLAWQSLPTFTSFNQCEGVYNFPVDTPGESCFIN